MKPILPLLFILLLITSCSKKSDVDPKNELYGAKWQTEELAWEYFYETVSYLVMEFKDNEN